MFKKKPTIEIPPIGELTFAAGHWQTKTPPPPLDSGGLLTIEAPEDGPTHAQVDAFNALAASYGDRLPAISAKLFPEYQSAQAAYELLPATSPAAIPGVTRLVAIVIHKDCSATLSYGLYAYHPPSRAVDFLDHQLNLILREGQIVDLLFEG